VLPCTAKAVEQSHRGIQHRYYPMLGFGVFESAQRFCQAFDEVHNFLRPHRSMAEEIFHLSSVTYPLNLRRSWIK
jgi:transposase-like protein